MTFTKIGLVSNEQTVHTFGSVELYIPNPVLHVCKGVWIANVVGNDNTMRAAVIRGSTKTQ
jgi:hypothetical protein